MDIEQARASGTWDISDNSSIDFGVQMTEVKNRAVSNFTQLNAWEESPIPAKSQISWSVRPLMGSSMSSQAATIQDCKPNFSQRSPDLQTAGEAVFASGRYDYSDFGRVWLETAVHTIARHPPYGLMTNEPRKKHSPLTFA